jgi:hypothetical protein
VTFTLPAVMWSTIRYALGCACKLTSCAPSLGALQERQPTTLTEFLSAGKDADLLHPAQLLGSVSTEPLIVKVNQEGLCLSVATHLSGVSAAFSTAVCQHAANAAAAFTAALQSCHGNPVNWISKPQRLRTAGEARQRHFTSSLACELALVRYGDKCKRYSSIPAEQPIVGKLVLHGIQFHIDGDAQQGTHFQLQDVLVLDRRSLSPRFRAVVEKWPRLPAAPLPALQLNACCSGANTSICCMCDQSTK